MSGSRPAKDAELAALRDEVKRLRDLARDAAGPVESRAVAGIFLCPVCHEEVGGCDRNNETCFGRRARTALAAPESSPAAVPADVLAAGAAFIMGPGGDEGTRLCTCHQYPHAADCGTPRGEPDGK